MSATFRQSLFANLYPRQHKSRTWKPKVPTYASALSLSNQLACKISKSVLPRIEELGIRTMSREFIYSQFEGVNNSRNFRRRNQCSEKHGDRPPTHSSPSPSSDRQSPSHTPLPSSACVSRLSGSCPSLSTTGAVSKNFFTIPETNFEEEIVCVPTLLTSIVIYCHIKTSCCI